MRFAEWNDVLLMSAFVGAVLVATSTAGEPAANLVEPSWESETHLSLALPELALLEFGFWGANRWLLGADWAHVSPETWARNLREGWEYDGDILRTNFVGHPYHGALFFNAGRANGHDFWTSWVFALAGSALWEFFAEDFRPAFNDWVLTGISGANLGEILHQLSILAVDNTATGVERVFREIAGTIINPVRGFTRIVTGESARVFDNPASRKPQLLNTTLTLGGRGIDADERFGSQDWIYQAMVGLDIEYRDVPDRPSLMPFASFNLGANLVLYSSGDETFERFSRISARGLLFGGVLSTSDDARQEIGIELAYDYIDNLSIEFGQTSIMGTWSLVYELSPRWYVTTGLDVAAVIVGATPNDYFMDPEGRGYDIGPGTTFTASGAIRAREIAIVRASYSSAWIWTMSLPDDSRHSLHFARIEAALNLSPNVSLGANAGLYWRKSIYGEHADVAVRVPIVGASLAVTP